MADIPEAPHEGRPAGSTDLKAVPALLQHCIDVYETMADEAQPATEGLVYTGFLTHIFADLELGAAYYTHITRLLKAMDCIRQVKRGAGQVPSVWLLMQEPTRELFDSVDQAKAQMPFSRGGPRTQQQRIDDLNERLAKVELQNEEILDFIRKEFASANG